MRPQRRGVSKIHLFSERTFPIIEDQDHHEIRLDDISVSESTSGYINSWLLLAIADADNQLVLKAGIIAGQALAIELSYSVDVSFSIRNDLLDGAWLTVYFSDPSNG